MGIIMNLAHRGASEYAPENTLAAFYKGLEMGAHGLETDLRMSKDGVVFLHHDDQLDRTTDSTGSPARLTWKELQELDAGAWFSPVYVGERLVSLDTFLHIFGRKPVRLVLELKEPGLEKMVIHSLEEQGLLGKVTITSFQYDILQAVRQYNGAVRIGYLVQQWDEEKLERLRELKAQQLCPRAETVTEENVRAIKQHGFEVRAWKVSSEALMKHCLSCGVDGMTVNFPDKLSDALRDMV
ncbi:MULTISPECIES: glycerophosphodiester phosphodiesterase [unclassified Paenibacillus]|uniref:glycerophosphodiester phosphodiesterase n=1 Tax=unclassified Paenibacillus TaxID=185978 RepID=UPI003628CEB5